MEKTRRNTVQKELVYSAVMLLDHPTADDVYDHIHQEHPNVSRGTVYRNLNMLAGNGTVRRFPMTGAPDIYDTTVAPHCHFHCDHCGKVADYPGILPKLPESEIPDNMKAYKVTGYDVIFHGVCPVCNKKTDITEDKEQ